MTRPADSAAGGSPLVSVVTVCRNEAARIEKTVRSVLGQTCADFEWIVLDGGSTDGTREILERCRDRMAAFRSGPDAGIYPAMNAGIALARGEFCLFMNGGDEFHDDEVLARFGDFAPKADVNYGGNVEFHRDGRVVPKFGAPLENCAGHLYWHSLPHQATFIRRELFRRLGGYDTSFRILADMEFFARAIVGHKASVAHLPWPVAIYRYDGLSARSKGTRLLRQELARYRRLRFGRVYMAKRWFCGLLERFRGRPAKGGAP